MNSPKLLTLLLLMSCYFLPSRAQQDTTTLNHILTQSRTFADDYPPEKVYLHFDKPYYSVGDTIWFKGYITEGQNQSTQWSKIVYVDVISGADSLIQTLRLPVTLGAAYGSIPLTKENFRQGNYYVRAYTVWMLNFSPDYFFYKNLVIGEAIDKQLVTKINFTGTAEKKNAARISFRSRDGKPYAGKQVSWQIVSNYDVISKGKTTTDASGLANISLAVDPKKGPLGTHPKLVTTFEIAEDEPVSASFDLKNLTSKNDLQFFPEGGELVEGIPSQIGVKGIKSDGLGIVSKGQIKDNLGNMVAEYDAQHMGMGVFYLNPETGKSYKAEVKFSDGTMGSYNLPAVKPSGIALQATNRSPATLDVRVVANIAYFEANKDKSFYVVAQHNGVVYFAAIGQLQKQVFTLKIPKNKMPGGLMQLTLFSSAAEPLSERLVFIKNKSNLNLAIKADKPSYTIKQNVKLSISTKDSTAAVPAFLSLSVTDESKVPVDENSETTILSSLLLTSDLQGYIEKPNYYFTAPSDKKTAELDMLMLTQGFRRFLYKDIMANKFPPVQLEPEQGITISGTLRNKTGLPINKGTLLLSIPDKRFNKQMLTSPVGLFKFKDLVFTDSSEVTVSGKYNPNPSSLMIMVDGQPEPDVGRNKNAAEEIQNIDSAITNYLANSAKQYSNLQTIKEVSIIGSKVKAPSHRDHSSLATLGPVADHVVSAQVLGKCNLLSECMRYQLPGVTFERDNFYVTRDFNAGRKVPMAIYIDGLNVDFAGINLVSPSALESIEVFMREELGTISRLLNTNGVIVINTKKQPKSGNGKFTKEDLKKLMPESYQVTYMPKGYAREREFYSPKYTADPAMLTLRDLRTTIYWNPKIVTDATGNTTVEFFNADGRGNYRAVLEGTDGKGNIARTVFRYLVK